MTTRWERLAGDTSVFALRLAFAPDPDEGRGIDIENAASWGSFQVWVQGRNLCAHREEGEHFDFVHWYMLPLLEWFAYNWDSILHEERLPVKNLGNTAWESLHATRFPPPAIEDDEEKVSEWEADWQNWWNRHALYSAREGGLFPDIVIRRLRDQIELSWGSVRGAGMPNHYRFTESERGFATLRPLSVAKPLYEILSKATQYLSLHVPYSERIRKLNRRLQDLNSADNARTQRLAWLAGLGKTGRDAEIGWHRVTEYLSEVAERPRQALLEAEETPLVIAGSCQAALMFGSLEPNVTKPDVMELAQAAADLFDPQDASGEARWTHCIIPFEAHGSSPRDQGYELAEEIHEHFEGEFEVTDFIDVEGLIEKLGIRVVRLNLSDRKVRGYAVAGPKQCPGIFINESHDFNAYDVGRRFTLSHELCHILFDREIGRPLAVAHGPWAPRAIEQRADAFAMMLLMPSFLVKRVVAELSELITTIKGLDELARRMRIGRRHALHHLFNLGFIDESDCEQMEELLLCLAWSALETSEEPIQGLTPS